LRTDTGERSEVGEFYFDQKEADAAVEFIEGLKHWQGEWAGKPFILSPYQRRTTEDIVGWKRVSNDTPRYRWVYVEVPKGNGKTPWGAALVLLSLHWYCVPGAEIYSVAGDREQARLVYNDAKGMTIEAPELAARSLLYTNSIVVPTTSSVYKVLSSEAKTKHGPRPFRVFMDEMHVQPNRNLFDTLKPGVEKGDDAQLIMLTTAGEYDAESLCFTEHEYALATLRPKDDERHIVDPSYYATIYAADHDDDPGDEEVWAKANPNLGVSVSIQGLRDAYRRASHNPVELSSFKRLRLNIWSESTQGVIDPYAWKACSTLPEPKGRCFLGMDLSSKIDLTAVVAYWPETHSVLAYFWLPDNNIKLRGRQDVFDYERYAKEGWITLTPGSQIDYGFPRKTVNQLAAKFDVADIGYDGWNATQMENWLGDEDGLPITQVRQGSKTLSEPFKEIVGFHLDHELKHGGNPVLTWNALNLAARRDPNDGWAPDKSSPRKRIDGMVALINARARALGDEGPSIYDTRGARWA